MSRSRRTRSSWLAVVGGAAAAATLVACHSSASPGLTGAAPAQAPQPPSTTAGEVVPPSPSPSATTGGGPTLGGPPVRPRPVGPVRCHTADLRVSLGRSDSGMGHTGLPLVLTNRSSHPCQLFGYGGVQLLDAAGRRLPTRQARVQPAPQLVRLTPGASAYTTLYWVMNPQAEPCEPAAFLLVIPPDETESIRTAFPARVCEQGRIQQTAYVAGTGQTG